jgi:glutathione S-transferase
MRELYEWPPTRSNRARWALEEVGADYDRKPVDLPAGEQDQSAYRAIHPLGVVPALRTAQYTMLESTAITLQVIDEYPACGLAPPPGSPERASYYQWCVFAAAEIDPALMMYFDNTMRPVEAIRHPDAGHDAGLAARGRHDFGLRASMLTGVLAGQPYLLGEDFSGADICIGHSCFMATFMDLLKDWPILEAYYQRLSERAAHRRVYGPV